MLGTLSGFLPPPFLQMDTAYIFSQNQFTLSISLIGRYMTVEAYASPDDTRRYYGTLDAPGAHYPFNFLLLTDFNSDTNAVSLKNSIDFYLNQLNDFQLPNWLVRTLFLLTLIRHNI